MKTVLFDNESVATIGMRHRLGSMTKNFRLVILLVILPFAALAKQQKVNGIMWEFTVSGGEAKVGCDLDDSFARAVPETTTGDITIPSILGNCPVTGISEAAFSSCTDLTSVTIPDGVTSIGNHAFSGCTNLTSVVIPDSVTSLGDSVFYYCNNLTSIVIPNGVSCIGRESFYNCWKLKSVTIPSTVKSIGSYAFYNCFKVADIAIPRGVSIIEENAFLCCIGLKSLSIPDGVTNIRGYAFSGCSGLTSATIPNSVTNIGNSAFSSCTNLTSVSIPDGVLSIGDYAFSGCSNLRRVTMPSSLRKLGSDLFRGAVNLLEVIVPETFDETIFPNLGNGLKIWRYKINQSGEWLYTVNENGDKLEFDYKLPSSPMDKDSNVFITPTTRNFGVNGGGNAIITSGSSATWTAAVSDSWITLNATSGDVGYPVAYTVSANMNVEQRTGYVYVSGWVHTVTQDGVGATISPENASFESDGGESFVSVTAQDKNTWKATSNVDWIGVRRDLTECSGSKKIYYQVLPFDEVATRQGTLMVAGNTFTVFQYGRRMKLESYSTTQNYGTHVIPVTVNALAITQWSVTPNNSWISVVDAGNGQGGDLVTIAIAENPSYKARTGTVTIGTETFTVTQQGRPTAALSFSVSPMASTASVEGANGLVSVTATPDLPWTATSGANWLTVYAATATGAGNGNVVYVASPNPTLSQRTGTITVTPEAKSGMTAKTHTVTQPAAQSALSMSGYEFEASGESCSVDVSVASIVEWSVSESLDWLTVNGSTSRVGPGTVTLQAAANNTVYPRSGTVTIAGKTFSVSQKARGVSLEYDTKLFGTDGGFESISIHPDGNSEWTAVANDTTWITIFQGDSGTGDGEILYIISPYVGDGSARTGWITIGDKKVYITQRAYDLAIEPNGTNVVGNAGAGEFGVSASIGDVWTAIATEPWITLVSGYDSGTGNGTVRFLYTENTTGKTRTGKIIVAGEVYTLEQRARQMVAITATADHGGHVSGGGSYDLGASVTLTAVPDSGYKFSYWTGAVESMQNPLVFTADVAKSVTAVFEPMPIAFTSVVSDTNGVSLAWNNLAWAATYRIYRGVTSVPSSATVLVELPNGGDCMYLDETGDVDTTYWYWIEAEGASDEVMSDPMTGKKEKPVVISPITYTNLRGATNPNPTTYREGALISFENPGALTGYTFAGWTPSQIAADMTGAQTVSAAWTANGYSIAYNPNGGSGTMDATAATYDSEAVVSSSKFIWAGHVFVGWATSEDGEVAYVAGQAVSNLTTQASGVVPLYAVWEDLVVAAPTVTPADGMVFLGESCTVTLSCATEGAVIYYSPKGATPRLTDAYRYTGPFAITDTATIKAVAVLEGVRSEYVAATITKRSLSLAEAAGATDVVFTTGGDAIWAPIGDETAEKGLSVQSGAIGAEEETWIEARVTGAGTFSFRWKVDCEHDDSGDASWDHAAVSTNGVEVARIDGTTGWKPMSLTFVSPGTHKVRWTFVRDDCDEPDAAFNDRAWVCGVIWLPDGGSGDIVPTIEGDDEATVQGDSENGYTVKPSEGKKAIVVTIPEGVEPEKVTVEVAATVETVTANGANVKVMKGEYDIAEHLDLAAATQDGVINLASVQVKEEVVKEVLDSEKGAEVDISDPESPELTTSETKPGLTYTLLEGATLEEMMSCTTGDSKVGDGEKWTPEIKVKGGTSGFYTIKVEK